ncbi:hypothetical protein ACFOUP_00015 [Belliella kenyensis]|uniref:Uncharacterized protein n=1 Tax=Belliella kenyensis TaxID=1472724 RepID=A0ABV8EEV9_9BACT|nr:hypothetical protein [Belliella kenyensis]MCH7403503.1 hypothetical protein [Belliella kenyensis]MDN3604975.1 hypothetical protein [Belliella kenyensis]
MHSSIIVPIAIGIVAAVYAYGVLTDMRKVKGLLGGIVGWLVDFRNRLF